MVWTLLVLCGATLWCDAHGDREHTEHGQGGQPIVRGPLNGQNDHFGADDDHNYEFDHGAILGMYFWCY